MTPARRNLSPLTTWHSQAGLLWISWTWGLSYVIPQHDRIPFAEVFPTTLASGIMPMWAWGIVLLFGATIALVAERLLRKTRLRPWRSAWAGHALLSATYFTLAVAALAQSFSEVTCSPVHWHFWGNVISAISRTVLWGYIGYLHTTYARLPHMPAEML